MKEGINSVILRYPKYALKCTLMHLLDTFAGVPWSPVSPWPETNTSWQPLAIGDNLFIAYLCFPLTLYGLWRKRREVGMYYLVGLPVFSLLSSAVLFHGESRFREPYDFCFLIGASVALEEWRRRRRPSPVGLIGEP